VSGEMAFLDVSVPMYAAGREHPYRDACVWLMTELAEGRLAAAIDTECVQEVLYRYGRLREWAIAATVAKSLLELATVVFPIEPADVGLASEWIERYGPLGVTARDVLHAAVMRNRGLTEIITVDKHFDLIEGTDRLDPQVIYDRGRAMPTSN
jgi:uncharacterized protein